MKLLKIYLRSFVALLLIISMGKTVVTADDIGYHAYTAMTTFLQQLAKQHSDLITMTSQGETIGKRNLWSLTVSAGSPDNKPAVLIVGGVEGSDLFGSELCLHFVNALVTQYGRVDSVSRLLQTTTFYIFPRVNPDAAEAYFSSPKYERSLNDRAEDLDKDGLYNEDGYDDLNKDGFISMMRIRDPAGDWMPDPEVPQLMRQADRAKGQKGIYRLYSEGLDNDADGRWNEDEPGGVNVNRNFSYNYQFFSPGAGRYQMSEIESNCVAQFAFSHPNICVVFSFSPNENLIHPWQAQIDEKAGDSNTPQQPEKPLSGVWSNDVSFFNQIAQRFKDITAYTGAPEPPRGEGAFNEWAYYHFGRWSFSTPAWWPPVLKQTADTSATDTTQRQGDVKPQDSEKPDIPDLIAGQRRLWKWLENSGQADTFIAWNKITHPDFPDEEVEIGGFSPYSAINPPADSIDIRSQRYNNFILHLASLLPKLSISKVKVEMLHENVFRLQVFVTNNGFLPTNTDLGIHSQWNPKVKLSLSLEKGQQLIDNKEIKLIDRIAGSGGTIEHNWVIMGKKGSRLSIKAECPMAGSDEKSVVLE
jgi:hypothetical protein